MDFYIFIIFIILLIIIILVQYFDLLRFCKSHIETTEEEDKQIMIDYGKKRKIKSTNRIIISFTTTPTRIHKFKPMLISLFKQSVRVDDIVLNLPTKCNNESYVLPKYLKNMVHIAKSGQDYGPATKCIPTLLRESEYGTIIILLDDDFIYGEDFIEMLLTNSLKYPNKAIISTGGMLVKPEFFVEEIFQLNERKITDNHLRQYIKNEQIFIKYINNFRILGL
jgi:hypothetical protein